MTAASIALFRVGVAFSSGDIYLLWESETDELALFAMGEKRASEGNYAVIDGTRMDYGVSLKLIGHQF